MLVLVVLIAEIGEKGNPVPQTGNRAAQLEFVILLAHDIAVFQADKDVFVRSHVIRQIARNGAVIIPAAFFGYRIDDTAHRPAVFGVERPFDDFYFFHRIGFDAANDRWGAYALAENLFDEEYLIDVGNTGGAFGLHTIIRGKPQMLKAGVYIKF